MVVWLKSSLVLLFLMTETSEELKKQTVKIIEGQPVVLGPKFAEREDNYASDVPLDKSFLDASRNYFLEKYYDVKEFFQKDEQEETKPVEETKEVSPPNQQLIRDLKAEIVTKPKTEDTTPETVKETVPEKIIPKEKPDEIKFVYDADLIARMIVTEAFDYDFSNPENKALAEAEMLAMANVVVNRANMKTGFSVGKGKTRIEKLIRSGDFKGVTEFEDRFNNPQKEYKEKYQLAFNIARNLLAGRLEDNTNGALYFNQDPKSKGFKHGKHYFYVEPYDSK